MAREGCRIAVIGAGFSGVMTAIHLLWRCEPGERVYLVERSGRIGPGLAYGTSNAGHLVNTRAENMSAFGDEPDHFVRWLEGLTPERRAAAGERTIAGTFVRRSVFGSYIQDLLRNAIARQDGADNLYLIADTATAMHCHNGALVLETANGRSYPIDAAVLALGNLPSTGPRLAGFIDNPWTDAATSPLEPGVPVVMLGTGLSMVDACLALANQGFDGPIHAISRRGLLPQSHAPTMPCAELKLRADDRRSLLTLFRAVRREVDRNRAIGWRSVIDALRPYVQVLWAELSPADKARFVRHVRAWWDVHRHRMAPSIGATVASLRASGVLQVDAGRILSVERVADRLKVVWRAKGELEPREIVAQRVIDCTGINTDYCRSDEVLLRQLQSDGLIRPAPLGLGVDCTIDGAILDARGQPLPHLFGVGPVTRGALWDITAVPEIRTQAEQVAERTLAAARRRFRAAA